MNADINTALVTAQSILRDVKVYVDSLADAKVYYPTYDEVQRKGVIYDLYRKYIEESDLVTRAITKLTSMSFVLRDMKTTLDTLALPHTLKAEYKTSIVLRINECNEYLKVLRDYKVHVDSVLRFCSGLQYLLASPRLWSVE